MLNRIEASNFKSFKHLNYKCLRLNILAGMNGAGKSSFIQMLLMMREFAKNKLLPTRYVRLKELGFSGKFDGLRYCYADGEARTAVRIDFTAKENFVYKMGDVPSGTIDRVIVPDENDTGMVGVVHPKLEAVAIQDKKNYSEIYNHVQESERSIASAFENLWEEMKFVEAFRIKPNDLHVVSGKYGSCSTVAWDCPFDPEGNDVVEYLYKAGLHRLDDSNPMVLPDGHFHMRDHSEVSYPPLEEDPLWLDSECPQGRKYAILRDQVNAWLNTISPGARFFIDRTELGDEEYFEVNVGFGDDNLKRFKPQNVGFGISNVLPVIVALLTARPTDVIIIENPEAHIHPRGQAELGSLIAKAAAYGVQVFVETHSDHIINGVRVAVRDGILKSEDVNIAFFERKEQLKSNAIDDADTEIYSEVRNIKVDANGALSEYPEDFMDEWNNQLMELMRS